MSKWKTTLHSPQHSLRKGKSDEIQMQCEGGSVMPSFASVRASDSSDCVSCF